MKLHGLLFSLALGVLLPAVVISGETQGQELCAPFKGGEVAPEKVQAMLSAAEDGHLYRIKTSTSRVGFCVDSKYSRLHAEFHSFQGGLSLWPDPGEEELAMMAIKAASLDTGSSMADYMLKSKYFFDIENYPEILFVSTAIDWTSPATAEIKGDLTLRGVTRAVTFQVQLTSLEEEPGGRIGKLVAKAGTTINRTDFGMDKFPHLVGGKVELCITAEVVRQETGVAGTATVAGQR